VMKGAAITNGGTVIWGGTGNVQADYGSVIENAAGGVFNVQSDAQMYWPGHVSPPVFNNDNGATFLKSGGTGTTTLSSIPFNNAGTLEVQSGSMDLAGNYNLNAGTIIIAISSSSNFGQLTLNGAATLGGDFILNLLNGY